MFPVAQLDEPMGVLEPALKTLSRLKADLRHQPLKDASPNVVRIEERSLRHRQRAAGTKNTPELAERPTFIGDFAHDLDDEQQIEAAVSKRQRTGIAANERR